MLPIYRIFTHPDNLTFLAKVQQMPDLGGLLNGVPIVTDTRFQKEQPSGHLRNPDGSVSLRDGWEFRLDKYVTYEEKDLSFLICAGIVQEIMEPVFLLQHKQDYNFNELTLDIQFAPTKLKPLQEFISQKFRRMDDHLMGQVMRAPILFTGTV